MTDLTPHRRHDVDLPAVGSDEEAEMWDRLTHETAARVNVHAEHDWVKDGRCFYCHDCSVRIGQEPLIASAMKLGLITHPRFLLAAIPKAIAPLAPDPLGLRRKRLRLLPGALDGRTT